MILAYLENNGGKLPKSSLLTIDAARKAKEAHGYSKAVGLLLGAADVETAAAKAAEYGLDEVVYVKGDELRPYLALVFESVFKKIIDSESPTVLLACASARGKDFMPRLAKYLDAGQASDVIEFLQGGLFKRPMYAGNVLADVEIVTEQKIVTIRSTAFEVPEKTDAPSPLRELSIQADQGLGQEFVSFDATQSERPELTEAAVVVGVGRAIKSAENLEQYIAPLADHLGAAIGATRAVVDAEYAPNDWQVGQTGKVIAPDLYIAIGISGAIQHLAGMKDSKVIVAINKDPEAPIFEIADYGLVADLYNAVPELVEALKKGAS